MRQPSNNRRLLQSRRPFAQAKPALAVLLVVLLLAGCGQSASDNRTPTPPQTPLLDLATSTPANPDNAGAAPPTPAPGERTVGQLADAMTEPWSRITSLRVTSTNQVLPVASPVAGASPVALLPVQTVIDEFLLNGRRHRTMLDGDTVTLEMIGIDGIVYARGTTVPGMPQATDPMTWRVIPADMLAADATFGEFYSGFLQPIGAPYSELSADERERIARPAGTISVDGASCDQFETAATTEIGERVTILIAVGANQLPCAIETRVASTINRSTFAYNVRVVIDIPTVSST